MSLDRETIEKRKETIQKDIQQVEKALTDIGAQRDSMQANLYALHGALQQCDNFLESLESVIKREE